MLAPFFIILELSLKNYPLKTAKHHIPCYANLQLQKKISRILCKLVSLFFIKAPKLYGGLVKIKSTELSSISFKA